jgi:predicted small lipoprotein YifL
MKRILVFLLALCTVVSFAACSKAPELEETEPVVNPDTNQPYYLNPKAGSTIGDPTTYDDTIASCDNSRDCTRAVNYTSVPRFLREATDALGFIRSGGFRGVY